MAKAKPKAAKAAKVTEAIGYHDEHGDLTLIDVPPGGDWRKTVEAAVADGLIDDNKRTWLFEVIDGRIAVTSLWAHKTGGK